MILLQALGCSSAPEYPKSDHYDGSRFFNPADAKTNGFWAAMKMLLTRNYEEWPESVENSSALDLNRKLGTDEVAVTFVNHATVLVQTEAFNFLTDPVWSERVSPVTWAGPKRHRPPAIPFDQLPKIDFVLISHNHYDHMDISTLQKLNAAFHPHFFVPLGNKAFLESCGISNVTELDWWKNFEFNSNLKVTLTPARHFSGRGLLDRDKTLWGSYMISFGERTIYFGGDTAYSPHFREIQDRLGSPDLAFLPIGAYEPRWFMKLVHMNPEEAVQAHSDLAARQSIGIHFGTFQLTNESINQPVKDLDAALKNKNLDPKVFVTLNEGKTQVFKINRSAP